MTARITQQELESYLWGAAVLLRGTIDAGDYKQFIFPLLFYKRLCDVFDEETRAALEESDGDKRYAAGREQHRFQIPREARWAETRSVAKNVGQALQAAMRSIETENPEKLYGIFGDAQWTNKDRLPDALLRDMIEHFSKLNLSLSSLPEDELGQGYEYLIKRFADDAGHTAAEFYTNRTVVHLMTEMLEPRPGESIYDPTCGSGGMLLSCITQLRQQGKEWRNVRLFGQERNLMTSSIARMNCFLHGIENFQIERGDTLSEPKFVEGDRLKRFDVVLANPPYSIKQWDREAFASDPWGRNLYGTPPQGRADYAFWQHILCSLTPKGGRCAILFPHGVLFRQEEVEMRRRLVESDSIECVVGLGPNLFYNSPMEACVVICRTAKPKARRGRILFINAVGEVARERGQSFLTSQNIERIVRSYRSFDNELGLAQVVAMDELRSRDASLNIALYVAGGVANSEGRTDARSRSLAGAICTWAESALAARRSLDALLGTETARAHGLTELKSSGAEWKLVRREGWSRMPFAEFAESIADRIEPANTANENYVGLEHLDPGDLHIRRWGKGSDVIGTKLRFRVGDIIFGRRRAYQRKIAVAEMDGICSAHAMVVRARPQFVAPQFLPFLMMSDKFMQRAVGISVGSLSPTINWTALRVEEFYLPPLEDQRRAAALLAAAYASVDAARELLKRLRSLQDAHVVERMWMSSTAMRPLGECARVIDPNPSHRYPLGNGSGVPLVSTANFLNEADYSLEGCDRVPRAVYLEQLARCEFERDDVVFARKGVIGLARMYGDQEKCFSHTIVVLKAIRERIAPKVLLSIVRSPRFISAIQRTMNANSGVPTLGLKTLAAILIPVPAVSEQERIESESEQVRSAIESAASAAAGASALVSAFVNEVVAQ